MARGQVVNKFIVILNCCCFIKFSGKSKYFTAIYVDSENIIGMAEND